MHVADLQDPMAASTMSTFVPSPRQSNLLILLACAALGYGFYLRYAVVEAPALIAACGEGLPRAVCSLRRFVLELADLQFFAGTALLAAVFHFVRPMPAALAVALVATAFGLTIGDVGASAFAAAILIMAFARPARASSSRRAPAGSPQTTGPASSRTSH